METMTPRAAPLRALRAALVALAAAACATGPPKAPPQLRVAVAEFNRIRGICVMPLRSEVDDPARVARFATLLVESLRQRGFSVVAATETTAALDRISREEGGGYDIYTGERDEAASRAISRRVRERLGEELSCQALLSPRIVYVGVFWLAERGLFSNGTASWDGARVDLGAGRNAHGSIGALSLQVRVADLDDRELYYGAGGIRTTSIMVAGWSGTQFEPIEPTQLLADEALNRRAIQLALEQLPLWKTGKGAP